MDATSSFTYIVDNAPKWRDQLSALITHTAKKQEEFKAEYVRLVKEATPRRRKTASIRSIHTDDADDADADSSYSDDEVEPPRPVDISPLEAGNKYIYAQANKKRKSGASFRSGASGPMKYRSKQCTVIYYDSFVQEQLDTLVKGFGGSRNNLRKGKMSYTITKGLQLPTLRRGVDFSSANPSVESVRSLMIPRNSPKIAAAKDESAPIQPNTPSGEAAFIQADKELESCQSQCETAAHQFLRDGDCTLELTTVLKALDRVLDLAKTTLDILKTEEASSQAPNQNLSAGSSTHTNSGSTLVEKPSFSQLNFSRKITPSMLSEAEALKQRPPIVSATSDPLRTVEIEVDDDSDQSSIEIDLSKYRSANLGRMRA